ncbi:WD40 repeat-like protein [Hypomontagnella monticulosa]|nr:WD40 repeat-like protein [Hypomontagnella monticulosa]
MTRDASSSGLLSPPRPTNGKERRNPSITPRKFRRFFTPRSRVPFHPSPAGKALRDLTAPDLNNRYQTPAPSSPLLPPPEYQVGDENISSPSTRLSKRRKIHHTPSSPIRSSLPPIPTYAEPISSPSIKPSLLSPIQSLRSCQGDIDVDSDQDESEDELPGQLGPRKRLTPLTSRGFAGQLAQRHLGGMPRAGRSFMTFPSSDWRIDTANFYSKPHDVHSCTSHERTGTCIPFCVATCHRNSLIAVGDEEGRVRVLESASNPSKPFKNIYLSFQAHSNAIIDLCFSDDDHRIATASGDQTGRVIDMITQTPIALLQRHTASLKQVRFQPGSNNGSVLATSSRDGSVQIWDLRCSGEPVQDIIAPDTRDDSLVYRRPEALKAGKAINSLYHAHARTPEQLQQAAAAGQEAPRRRRELPNRVGDVSVTALQFLPSGQEHLLLTACEADASIKLWDIRSLHWRQKVASPLSATAPPSSHHWRPFGISSLALNTDASRLYASCKDNTVYAYSTAHLILGSAPELSTRSDGPPRRRPNAAPHQGLGPMYGFRHPSFHATSFYVKCAVRPARDGRSELLAVGSSNSCAVLFPTQERYFQDELSGAMGALSLENSTIATSQQAPAPAPADSAGVRRPLFRSNSSANLSARLIDGIPIVKKGTPLVRGHSNEVGAVAWSHEGKLVTVADDYKIRNWSEGTAEAADLRTGGETGGRRWGCGWAEVGEDWDVPDDDED